MIPARPALPLWCIPLSCRDLPPWQQVARARPSQKGKT
jgi:hypothetical protein